MGSNKGKRLCEVCHRYYDKSEFTRKGLRLYRKCKREKRERLDAVKNQARGTAWRQKNF